MAYRDLRDFIEQVDRLGTLRRIENADAMFELGAITEVAAGLPECPALLFDNIKGYAPGFRVLTNVTTSPQRAALALGIDPTLRPLDALKAWKEKRRSMKPRQPVSVKDAPVLANPMVGEKVDLGNFPAPYWHKKDGGSYIGSGSLVVMRDPDAGWINASNHTPGIRNIHRIRRSQPERYPQGTKNLVNLR